MMLQKKIGALAGVAGNRCHTFRAVRQTGRVTEVNEPLSGHKPLEFPQHGEPPEAAIEKSDRTVRSVHVSTRHASRLSRCLGGIHHLGEGGEKRSSHLRKTGTNAKLPRPAKRNLPKQHGGPATRRSSEAELTRCSGSHSPPTLRTSPYSAAHSTLAAAPTRLFIDRSRVKGAPNAPPGKTCHFPSVLA